MEVTTLKTGKLQSAKYVVGSPGQLKNNWEVQ